MCQSELAPNHEPKRLPNSWGLFLYAELLNIPFKFNNNRNFHISLLAKY